MNKDYGCWNVARKWYQNISLFSQNKFLFNTIYLHDIKKYFYSIKINFCSKKYIYVISKFIFFQSKQICIQKEIFLLYNFYFHPIKIFFNYMNFLIRYFSSDHIWSTIFISKNPKFSFSILNWIAARCCKKATKKHTEY